MGGASNGARLNLPKTLKHDNLVELNMSALAQEESAFGAGIDRNHFKEIFGNLNWNKFAERISQQLSTNTNLTAEQRRLMQVNLIVALIRSNQFEQAHKEWEKARSSNTADKLLLSGINVFFALKDKKFDEALQSIKDSKDSYSIFLRAQIHIAKKEGKAAFELLATNLNDQLASNDDYLIFLVRQCIN